VLCVQLDPAASNAEYNAGSLQIDIVVGTYNGQAARYDNVDYFFELKSNYY